MSTTHANHAFAQLDGTPPVAPRANANAFSVAAVVRDWRRSKEELIQQIYEALYQQNGEEKEQKLEDLAKEVADYLNSTGSDDEDLIDGLSNGLSQTRKIRVRMWYEHNKTDWRLGEITP